MCPKVRFWQIEVKAVVWCRSWGTTWLLEEIWLQGLSCSMRRSPSSDQLSRSGWNMETLIPIQKILLHTRPSGSGWNMECKILCCKQGLPICLGCYFPAHGYTCRLYKYLFRDCANRVLKETKRNFLHRQCSAPLCGPTCEEKSPHEQVSNSMIKILLSGFFCIPSQECLVLSKYGVGEKLSKDAQLLWLVTPLRLLLLSTTDPIR